MADEMEFSGEANPGGKKSVPSWIWIAAGGGLLLMLLANGNKKQSSVETDNLLAAEVDAALKASREQQEAAQKDFKEAQQEAWQDFKESIEDLMRERYGTDAPAAEMSKSAETSRSDNNSGRAPVGHGNIVLEGLPSGMDLGGGKDLSGQVLSNLIYGYGR